ncbi:Rv3654c family TadE-like protein [Sinomonas mesophila]|uniref:Rv3654c family TadE-like protein n=1 Tax=Sinomonas mesophila TaxID=1531955 RepID=UPI000986EED8|nr:Rv3654c family TadE-like protein [Sinomonas mesophila]
MSRHDLHGDGVARPPTPGRPSRLGERGAGTILALGLGLLIIAACGAVGLLGQALAVSSRSASAADLAALAAADAERGLRPGSACAVASEAAGLNAASVVSCEVEIPGSTVRVVVNVDGGPLLGPVLGRARAGPPP